MSKLPILYSFRRCPYAIRARMSLQASGVSVELREVVLKSKPPEFLHTSPKGTVPVLVCENGEVLEESLYIMLWAMHRNNQDSMLPKDMEFEHHPLIISNDGEFKYWLDHYKYADRFPEHRPEFYRGKCELQLAELETILQKTAFLHNENLTVLDLAIFPFIRQFAFTDKSWFDQSPYPAVKNWLAVMLQHPLFLSVMQKYPAWQSGDPVQVFPDVR